MAGAIAQERVVINRDFFSTARLGDLISVEDVDEKVVLNVATMKRGTHRLPTKERIMAVAKVPRFGGSVVGRLLNV